MPLTEAYVGHGAYSRWVENLKIAQRPLWATDQITECFVCEVQFGFWERMHNCRKCGTAVCSQCAKYFVAVPELAYKSRVRICVTCIEEIFKKKYAGAQEQASGE
mmetsp:Transcript_24900/g.33360  ORF Transcript_24900/g.33360 Transcript_24900/m.33360 type:complete len:105 (-) Transcript_24900:666-980(-)